MTIRILFVSTGGICRAPMAVGALRTIASCAVLADSFEIDGAATYPSSRSGRFLQRPASGEP